MTAHSSPKVLRARGAAARLDGCPPRLDSGGAHPPPYNVNGPALAAASRARSKTECPFLARVGPASERALARESGRLREIEAMGLGDAQRSQLHHHPNFPRTRPALGQGRGPAVPEAPAARAAPDRTIHSGLPTSRACPSAPRRAKPRVPRRLRYFLDARILKPSGAARAIRRCSGGSHQRPMWLIGIGSIARAGSARQEPRRDHRRRRSVTWTVRPRVRRRSSTPRRRPRTVAQPRAERD